ncbi:glutamate synthase, NADH/NADPH, small subunit [mine drainage metagenome]|uniref:Glutamate synthase, NADH/NADPH, small subunit n=1 Tax=mine drainage metagenome TaxID=410659 RepID=T1BCE8_9ZZZZ
MGKPTGFVEYMRELPVDRVPLERVRDWREFHHHMDEKRLRNQAARCMDCGVPFCHTGELVSGMASGCPIHNLIRSGTISSTGACGAKRSSDC